MTQDLTPFERRKMVCRALANVLRKTSLEAEIDSKAFYMMLRTNFAVLDGAEGIDLNPIWVTLGGPGNLPRTGLMLAFERRIAQLGFDVVLPQEILSMDPEARARALQSAYGEGREVSADLIPVDEEAFDTSEMPELSPAELRPMMSVELRREIIQAVVRALKKSQIGHQIDGSQLAYRMDQSFDDLCDGRAIDVASILQRLEPFDPDAEDMYVALARMERRLAELGIQLRAPDLGIDPKRGATLISNADTAEAVSPLRPSVARSLTSELPPPHARAESGLRPSATSRRSDTVSAVASSFPGRRYGSAPWCVSGWQAPPWRGPFAPAVCSTSITIRFRYRRLSCDQGSLRPCSTRASGTASRVPIERRSSGQWKSACAPKGDSRRGHHGRAATRRDP